MNSAETVYIIFSSFYSYRHSLDLWGAVIDRAFHKKESLKTWINTEAFEFRGANALEIDRRKIYARRTEYKVGSPVRGYRIAEGFKSAALDNDWPARQILLMLTSAQPRASKL